MSKRARKRAPEPAPVLETEVLGSGTAIEVVSRLVVEKHPTVFGRLHRNLFLYAYVAENGTTDGCPDPPPAMDRARALRALGLTKTDLREELEHHGRLSNRALVWLAEERLPGFVDRLLEDGPVDGVKIMQQVLDFIADEEYEPGRGREDEDVRSYQTVHNHLSAAWTLFTELQQAYELAEATDPDSTKGTVLERWRYLPKKLRNNSRATDKEQLDAPLESAQRRQRLLDTEIAARLGPRLSALDHDSLCTALRHQSKRWYRTSGLFRLLVDDAILALGYGTSGRVGQLSFEDEADMLARLRRESFIVIDDLVVPGFDDMERPVGGARLPRQKGRKAEYGILTARQRRRVEVLIAFLEGYLKRPMHPDEPLLPVYLKLFDGRLRGLKRTAISQKFCGAGISRNRGLLCYPCVALIPVDPDSVGLSGRDLVLRDLGRLQHDSRELKGLKLGSLSDQQLLELAERFLGRKWDPWRGPGTHSVFRRMPDQGIADHGGKFFDDHPNIPGRTASSDAAKEAQLGHTNIPGDPLRYSGNNTASGRKRLRCVASHIVQELLEGDLALPRGPDRKKLRETCLLIGGLRDHHAAADADVEQAEAELAEVDQKRELSGPERRKAFQSVLRMVKSAAIPDAEAVERCDEIASRSPAALAERRDASLSAHQVATAERQRIARLLDLQQVRLRWLLHDPAARVPLTPEDASVDPEQLVRDLLSPTGRPREARLLRNFLLKSELCELAKKRGLRLSETTFDRYLDCSYRPDVLDRLWSAYAPPPVAWIDDPANSGAKARTALIWVEGLNPTLFHSAEARAELNRYLIRWPAKRGWGENGAKRKRLPLALPTGVERRNDFAPLAPESAPQLIPANPEEADSPTAPLSPVASPARAATSRRATLGSALKQTRTSGARDARRAGHLL